MGIKSSTLLLFLISICICCYCSKKESEPVVAKVGNTKITVAEFHDRYEFSPQFMQTKDKEQNKRKFLISLLGEKAFAEEAYNRNLHKTEKFLTYSKQMEKEAIVEALFDKEITSKIEVTQDELKQAYVRSKRELEIQVLNFDDEGSALKAKQLITEGKSFPDVKRMLQTQDFISVDSVLTLPLKWGEAHPGIEDAAYGLKVNEVSEPVAIQGRYFILKLINQKKEIFLTEHDFYSQVPSLKKVIRRRRSSAMFDEFMGSVMEGKKLRVSHEVFDFVAAELEKIYFPENDQTPSDKAIPSKKEDETALSSAALADHLNDTFARFDDGSTWTIGDFIKSLSVGPFPVDKKSKDGFRRSLRRVIRRMAEFESLANKGYKLGLDKTAYVKYQSQMWNDSYLAQELRKIIIDTMKVSNAEIEHYYNSNSNKYIRPEMLKLQEILVDDKNLAQKLYRQIQQGKDMAKLARQYSKRDISRAKGGIAGFFTTQIWGEIGKVAANLKKGELGGPVKTEKNQFSVFKVIDKIPYGVTPLNQVHDDVKQDVLTDKRVRELDGYLTELCENYDINIYSAVYDTIKTFDISMMVLKRHFPNRFAAPPVTPLNTSHRWQNKMDTVFPK